MSGMPVQSVSMKVKETEDWKQSNMDFFDYVSGSHQQDKVRDLKKYKSLSPEYKASDYMYAQVAVEANDDEYGNEEEVTHFPIMASPINTIVGEYVKRPLNFYCISTSTRARNEHYRVKTDRIKQYAIAKIQQRIIKSLVAEGHKPDEDDFQDQIQAKMPEEIQDYMNKKYTDIGEQIAQKLLSNLWKSESLDLEFLDGFKHAVITAKEFYHIYSIGNKTKIKCISPLDVFYHKSPNARWVSDAQYAGFRLYLTPSSIIDMCRPVLTVADIEKMEELVSPDKKNQAAGWGDYRTDVFATHQGATFGTLNVDAIDTMVDQFQHTGQQGYFMNSFGLVKFVQAYWKSYKLIGSLEYFDENDDPQEMIVDENYVVDKSAGQDITWGYMTQIYQGSKIHDNIYIDIGPYKHQYFDQDDLEYCPLPIEGVCYNDLHMKPTSLVDLMLAWNELYNIVAAELKKDMRKAIGKVMFMSYDNLPKIPGFTKEKWLYWVREFGIAWVGNNKSQNGNFSHYSSQDMSFAEQMIAKMNILEKIKYNCDAFAGFAPGRVAAQSPVDTVGQENNQINASVNQTEYWYFKHSKLIERVLTHAINIAKSLLKNQSYLRNMLDDMDIAYIETENMDLANEKIHVFVTNSSEALADKEALRSLVQPAMQNGGDISDGAEIILAKTQSEVQNVLDNIKRQNAERRQQEQQMEQQKLQTEKQIADDDRAWEKEKLYATLGSQERQKMIMTFGFQDDNTKDTDGNGNSDMLDMREQMINEQAIQNKSINDRMKMSLDQQKAEKDHSLKSRELDIKEKEIKTDEKNQKNDLQIARIQSKNKSKS